MLDEAIATILSRHYPAPPAGAAELSELRRRLGCLPDELERLLRACNGASLFSRHDPAYRLLGCAEIVRTRVALFGEDSDEYGPPDWFALFDVRDTNVVSFVLFDDVIRELRDTPHEIIPNEDECRVVSSSVGAFLTAALRSRGKPLYWL